MLFNNSDFGQALSEAVTKSLYSDMGKEGNITPPPPPTMYFLMDNTGDILFDNTSEPFLVVGS
jgi:hypothetical protein